MLSARNRMTRSAEFAHTVKHGVRATQPDLVVHAYRAAQASAPQVGLIVSKSVGGAVDRHRVARRLRHVARTVVDELDPADRIVVRALPSSCGAESGRLQQQMRAGVCRAHALMDRHR
ncbi:MAG: ribonuclease P protein component [Mycobacterium sp.]